VILLADMANQNFIVQFLLSASVLLINLWLNNVV